jgi:RimJ/RimL family protein N-acetyltransferase
MMDRLSLGQRPPLVTERLSLRRPCDDDIDAIVSIVGDWEVARRLARVPHPYGPADARFFLGQIVPAAWVWAITLHGADDLVGVVGLHPEHETDAAELGYWLSPRHWGVGIATEAGKAVLHFGFETLGLSQITSGYFEDNPASGRVLEKLGFVAIGQELRSCLATGRETPSLRMTLSRSG